MIAHNQEIARLKAELARALVFYRFQEHSPAEGQQIVCVRGSKFYNDIEIRSGEAEYLWEEYDPEDGKPTGATFIPATGEELPENCKRLVVFVSGVASHTMQDDDLWAPVTALQNLVDPEET